MPYNTVRSVAASVVGLLLCPVTLPYGNLLQSESVREAYFLGQRHDEKMAAFLDTYAKHLSLPEAGPYVSTIKLLTPFAQVVELSRLHTNYSAQQAEMDYQRRGDMIRVCVTIEFTATYNRVETSKSQKGSRDESYITLRSEDFWKDFQFGLSQNDKWIEPLEINGEPVYGHNGMTGAEVWLEYDSKDVASAETDVDIFTPDGQHIVIKFDLEKLR